MAEADELAGAEFQGMVDYHGYHSGGGRYFFVGWIEEVALLSRKAFPITIQAEFERGKIVGQAISAHFFRPDLTHARVGIVLSLPASGHGLGRLVTLTLTRGHQEVARLVPHASTKQFTAAEIAARVVSELRDKQDATGDRDGLLMLSQRRGFAGEDTLSKLKDPVHIYLDHVIFVPPDGLLLAGWLVPASGSFPSIRVRAGQSAVQIDETNTIWIPRPDVVEAFPEIEVALECGFVTYVNVRRDDDDPLYMEIESLRYEVGYKPLKLGSFTGLQAIKHILSCFDFRRERLAQAMDVVGPAIGVLNAERLRQSPRVQKVQFGQPVEDPLHSLIIPLYGRVDFLEYQVALFALHGLLDTEIIYVLDDPPRGREVEGLAASVYARFRVPLTLVALNRNVGYAPANNIGLTHAKGRFVCLLNSDVFPTDGQWLRNLSKMMENDEGIGAAGPVLLFENGCIQHNGIEFERLAEFANWNFPLHPGKGMKAGAVVNGPTVSTAITAACMVMRRDVLLDLGGFDESYIVGDFEDTDLCLRLHARRLKCCIDPAVRLLHLERKSQASAGNVWRMNLTLYNAWLHHSRWFRDADQ